MKPRPLLAYNLILSAVQEHIDQASLIEHIQTLSQDPAIDGLLIQLPLPKHLNTHDILKHVPREKDIDGFHPHTLGCLLVKHPTFRPCTPQGIMRLLAHANIPLQGKHAVVVGTSPIVGRPMALELLLADATVTLCHKFTEDLEHMYVRRTSSSAPLANRTSYRQHGSPTIVW